MPTEIEELSSEDDCPEDNLTDNEKKILDNTLFNIYTTLGQMDKKTISLLSDAFIKCLEILSLPFVRNVRKEEEDMAKTMLESFKVFSSKADGCVNVLKKHKLEEEWQKFENIFKMENLTIENHIYVHYIDPSNNFDISNLNTFKRNVYFAIIVDSNDDETKSRKLLKEIISKELVNLETETNASLELIKDVALPLVTYKNNLFELLNMQNIIDNSVITNDGFLLNLCKDERNFVPLSIKRRNKRYILERVNKEDDGHYLDSLQQECVNYKNTIEKYIMKLKNFSWEDRLLKKKMQNAHINFKNLCNFLSTDLKEPLNPEIKKIWSKHIKFLDNHFMIFESKKFSNDVKHFEKDYVAENIRNLHALLKSVLQLKKHMHSPDKNFSTRIKCYKFCSRSIGYKTRSANIAVFYTSEIKRFSLNIENGDKFCSYVPNALSDMKDGEKMIETQLRFILAGIENTPVLNINEEVEISDSLKHIDDSIIQIITEFKKYEDDYLTLIITKHDNKNLHFNVKY